AILSVRPYLTMLIKLERSQTPRCGAGCYLFLESRQTPGSNGLANLFYRSQVCGKGLKVPDLGCAVTAFGVEKIEKRRAAVLVCIFADVAAFLGRLEIAGQKNLNEAVVGHHSFVGFTEFGQHLAFGRFLLLLGLRDAVTCTRNLTLISVKDRKRDAE